MLLFDSFVAWAQNLRLWEKYRVSIDLRICIFTVHSIFQFPQLDDPIVRRQQLWLARVVQEFEWVDFFVELKTFKMIELWFVRLYFREISVVEVARILQICVAEDNYSAAFVADS